MTEARIPFLAKQGWLDDKGLRHDSTLSSDEESRLVGLASRLNPNRIFTVERLVVDSTPAEERRTGTRRLVLVPFTMWAMTGAEAARMGDLAKFNREKEKGWHRD